MIALQQLLIEKGEILVEAQGASIIVNGDPVTITIGTGYASPSNGMSTEVALT